MASQNFMTKNGTKGIELINLIQAGKPISRNQVQVKFSKDYDRKSDPWIEEKIKLIWSEKCQKNNRLYNQSKFRLAGVTNHEGLTIMNLGLTTYMDLMGTNCHPFGKELIPYGTTHFQNSRACLADALGVGSLLLTADNQFIFLKRALWTGEEEGKLDRPGGHAEPDNVAKVMATWSNEECNQQENLLRIRNEVFDSALHEVRDEVNLPVESLQDPLLLGVSRSLERLGRPSVEFLIS